MRRRHLTSAELKRLVDQAAERPMTPEGERQQLISYAYGNLRVEGEQVPREMVEAAVRKLLGDST
jgi:hypothetical protein